MGEQNPHTFMSMQLGEISRRDFKQHHFPLHTSKPPRNFELLLTTFKANMKYIPTA
jgi:hypothetical protein